MRHEKLAYELVVTGGGMAGIAAAIFAARRGVRTALIHDRPVLGGAAGKEVRLPLESGAAGSDTRYAREGGLVEELLLENLHRNPLGSAEIWDTVLLDAVMGERHLDVYLSATVTEVRRHGSGRIESVIADSAGAERSWTFEARLFADCTGAASVAALAGAEVARPGAGEAPGAAVLFALRDAGEKVPFVPPRWARPVTAEDVRRQSRVVASGRSQIWSVGYEGEESDPELVRLELLRTVYGVIDRLKNSPEHAAANANLAVEWVGALPVRHGGRRFAGPRVLSEERPELDDAIAATPSGSTSVFRSLFSAAVPNLMVAGRAVAASSDAPASSAQMGEAVGAAAFHCLQRDCLPAGLLEGRGIYMLQQDLLGTDHRLPGMRSEDQRDLARTAAITESSVGDCALETPDGEVPLDRPRALMLPLAGRLDHICLLLGAHAPGKVGYALHGPDPEGRFLPGVRLHEGTVSLEAGEGDTWVELATPFDAAEPGFYWVILEPAGGVSLRTTRESLVGVVSFENPEGAPAGPPWRKRDDNYCFRTDAWLPAFFGGDQVANGYSRPLGAPNIWISAPTDFAAPEWLELRWEQPQEIGAARLFFNTDLDRELRSVWEAPGFRRFPECVRAYRLLAWDGAAWQPVVEELDNYQRYRAHQFAPVTTQRVRLEISATNGDPRTQVYEVRLYPPG